MQGRLFRHSKAGSNVHRLVRVTARDRLVLKDRRLDGSTLTTQVHHSVMDLGSEIGPQYAPDHNGPFRVRIEGRQRGCDHPVLADFSRRERKDVFPIRNEAEQERFRFVPAPRVV